MCMSDGGGEGGEGGRSTTPSGADTSPQWSSSNWCQWSRSSQSLRSGAGGSAETGLAFAAGKRRDAEDPSGDALAWSLLWLFRGGEHSEGALSGGVGGRGRRKGLGMA